MTDIVLPLNLDASNCASNDPYLSTQCALQKISGKWEECKAPHLSVTKDLEHQKSVYIDTDHVKSVANITFGIKRPNLMRAAYGNAQELTAYIQCLEKQPQVSGSQSMLALAKNTLKWIDYASWLLILTPGSLISALCKKLTPRLAVKITGWLAKHALTRALAYITSSNFAKAVLMAATHVLNNGAKSFEPDTSILKDWFGEGRAWVTVPIGGALIAGIGLFAKRFAWSEIALNTLFSTTAGLHHYERMNLNAKLVNGSGDKAIEDKLRTHAFDISLFLLFSGTAMALNDAKWLGTATCAVDDILPVAVRVLKAQEAH